MGNEAAMHGHGVNPGGVRGVAGAMDAAIQDTTAQPAAPIRERRRSRRDTLGRSFAVSFALHAAIVCAGVTGGASYARRSGALARDEGADEDFTAVAVVFSPTPRPPRAEPFAAATVEPPRSLEAPASEDEAEPRAVESASGAEPLPLSSSEVLASLPSMSSARAGRPTDIGEVLGDPRSSFKSASQALPGLGSGGVAAAQVSDCCGEPQPAPKGTAAREVYVYPEVVKMVRAEFPERSQRLGEEGTVLLEMEVGADGLVKGVTVIESSGHPRIDDCAVDAAWGWVFKPATCNGVPVAALAHHRYTFRLISGRG